MKDQIQNLKNQINESLVDMSIIVDDINIHSEGKYVFLTIVLDKINGIDLDTIVEATNIINPIVDEYDFIDESFILDVISKEKGN